MGLDRFTNFISRYINNESIEEINVDKNIRKIISNHIIFDLNFLIYQEILEIENEINDIIKIILCLPFCLEKNETLEELLKLIFSQKHWKFYYDENNLQNLFDGFNEDEIIHKFIIYIMSKISSPNGDINNINSLAIIELVIYEKIINVLVDYIKNIHQLNFIQSISIFYDGIPSYSKVIEQRKRRIKNNLESHEKKHLFKSHFENLLPNNKNVFENLSKNYNICIEKNSVILFDYFKWIKNRFSIDKSLGPSSIFIRNLELFMDIKLKQYFPKFNIYINSAKENGESDNKIFKYISTNQISGDYCIHTTDSDLIHQILVQQTYYKITNKDIHFTLVKYIKKYQNQFNYAQIFESDLIIKNIMELYNNSNNIKTNNYKIIWDLCLIFFLFGNDHVPSSFEIGPELGLDFFIKKHYQALNKNNIVSLKKSNIIIDLSNLKLYLEKINQTRSNNITKIILQRFFKLNLQVQLLFIDKLDLNFDQILTFLEIFITKQAKLLDKPIFESLDEYDLRKIYVNANKSSEYESLNLNEYKIKLINENINIINESLDYYENDFNGLILYNKPQNITLDPYQDLYNYINDKSIDNINKKYPIYNDYININDYLKKLSLLNDSNDINNSNDYLKNIYHLVTSQFGNMKDYHSNNLTWYKYHNIPSINNLIDFISNIPINYNQTNQWLKEIKEDNVDNDKYLNSNNHYLIITPFLSFYNIPANIKQIVAEIGDIDNLWINDNFNYRCLDIKKFFELWNEAIIKINLNIKSNKITDEIVNINLDF
jgi:hypothetical protein